MYQTHPLLKEPDDSDILWRYIDLFKFVSLLEKKSLFFSAPKVFGDPFEGHFPKYFYDKAKEIRDPLIQANNLKFLRWSADMNQQHHCVSCWHRASHESAAMWKLYSNNQEGIAITTTFCNFKKALDVSNVSVSGGLVKYIDYERESISELNLIVALTLKRKSFEHEKEFRAIVMGEIITDNNLKRDNGYYVPINIDTLIDKIFISPSVNSDYKDVVVSLLNKYGYSKEILQSNLDEGPGYIG